MRYLSSSVGADWGVAAVRTRATETILFSNLIVVSRRTPYGFLPCLRIRLSPLTGRLLLSPGRVYAAPPPHSHRFPRPPVRAPAADFPLVPPLSGRPTARLRLRAIPALSLGMNAEQLLEALSQLAESKNIPFETLAQATAEGLRAMVIAELPADDAYVAIDLDAAELEIEAVVGDRS